MVPLTPPSPWDGDTSSAKALVTAPWLGWKHEGIPGEAGEGDESYSAAIASGGWAAGVSTSAGFAAGCLTRNQAA